MSFTDIEGGLVNTLFKLWMTYIDYVTTGEVLAYRDDIIQRRLNYTVSIYRFLVDPTNRHIVNAAKCTGCFPIDRPSGARFDVSRSERYIEAAKNFTIQFACNKFEEDDPIILLEFNTLMRRYNPDIDIYQDSKVSSWKLVPFNLTYNYVGLPYIRIDGDHRPILEFRYKPIDTEDESEIDSLDGKRYDKIVKLDQKLTDIKNIVDPANKSTTMFKPRNKTYLT